MEISEMKFEHSLRDNVAIFDLEGSLLGEGDRQLLRTEFMNYLDKGVKHFLINMTNLKHVNSTGLGVFITLYTKVKGKDGEMILANPTESIVNLLTITKLTSVFSIVSSVDEGLKRLQAR